SETWPLERHAVDVAHAGRDHHPEAGDAPRTGSRDRGRPRSGAPAHRGQQAPAGQEDHPGGDQPGARGLDPPRGAQARSQAAGGGGRGCLRDDPPAFRRRGPHRHLSGVRRRLPARGRAGPTKPSHQEVLGLGNQRDDGLAATREVIDGSLPPHAPRLRSTSMDLATTWTLTACGLMAHADGVLDGEECDRITAMIEEEVGTDADAYAEWLAVVGDRASLEAK